ncbi:MAG: hypothetical protein JW910_17490 [Anaerolineae bacterium]|nr:hypothetical protein [Anaerolineae bacterium]
MRIARHWRLNAQRYALQGVRCSACSANIFPPREVCPYCESKLEPAYEFETTAPARHEATRVYLEHAAR